jgi:hypothetical protein
MWNFFLSFFPNILELYHVFGEQGYFEIGIYTSCNKLERTVYTGIKMDLCINQINGLGHLPSIMPSTKLEK